MWKGSVGRERADATGVAVRTRESGAGIGSRISILRQKQRTRSTLRHIREHLKSTETKVNIVSIERVFYFFNRPLSLELDVLALSPMNFSSFYNLLRLQSNFLLCSLNEFPHNKPHRQRP